MREIAPQAFATLVGLAILISLGVWQLQRKTWKEGLIAQIDARAYGPPGEIVAAASWPHWNAADDEFRRVRLTGTLLNDKEVPVHGLAAGRPGQPLQGFYIFTPLRRDDGRTVMINRGFVPTAFESAATRPKGEPQGETTVTGLVRAPETRHMFVPANDVSRNDWFTRDTGEMGQARGVGPVAPFYIDADATPNPGGWPRGGQTRLTLPNDHLQYALTWFGLAATLVAVFAVSLWRQLRPKPIPPPPVSAPAEP